VFEKKPVVVFFGLFFKRQNGRTSQKRLSLLRMSANSRRLAFNIENEEEEKNEGKKTDS